MKAQLHNKSATRFQTRCSRRRAFTLVEILIVLVVIGLLAALLLPVFNNARNSARSTACQSNLKQIGLALQLYLNDSSNIYPEPFAIPQNCTFSNSLVNYTRSTEVFTCPSAPNEFYQPGCLPDKHEGDITYHYDGGYIMNLSDLLNPRLSQMRIRRPTQMILLVDGETGQGVTQPGSGTMPITADRLLEMGVQLRHREGANALYADGHVKWLSSSAIADRSAWTLSGRDSN